MKSTILIMYLGLFGLWAYLTTHIQTISIIIELSNRIVRLTVFDHKYSFVFSNSCSIIK